MLMVVVATRLLLVSVRTHLLNVVIQIHCLEFGLPLCTAGRLLVIHLRYRPEWNEASHILRPQYHFLMNLKIPRIKKTNRIAIAIR
jgi:hypothetical protein